MIIKPKFVHYMPKIIEEGILYISPEFRAVIHRCACGCGEKVHTPLSPTNWKMIYDGKRITLSPSIGNWSYTCRSHYWIRDNEVVWAENWSDSQVKSNREFDKKESDEYYETLDVSDNNTIIESQNLENEANMNLSLWSRITKWFQKLK